jgi:polyisoprenoid-binding protein YceI
MKTTRHIFLGVMILAIAGITIQCQHDDELDSPIKVKGPDPIERGTETVSCTDCTPANFDANNVGAGVWYFDKAHSNVMWETSYRVLGSSLTGRFDVFYLKSLTFDEANPASMAFEGSVWLNTVNTGEPGRDDGCLLGTYGTEAGFTTESANQATIVTIAGSGKYRSPLEDGYVIDANLTFHGFTKKVTLKLDYFPLSDQGSYTMVGFSAEFDFLSKTDFAVSSSNIDDKVKVKINVNLKNKKS